MTTKHAKIAFWISTTIIFLFEGVLTALTSRSAMSIQGITSLGYPLYFVMMLTVAKGLGSLALILPQVPPRVKEWAYAGFGFDFISAFVSIWIVAGINATLLLPVAFFIILVISYKSYHRMNG